MARPKALLLTIREDNSEMEELVFSLGYDLVDTIHQKRTRADPQWFLGRGKLEEAREHAHALGVELVVVNDALKPNQLFNLNEFFQDATSWTPPSAADQATGNGADGRAEAEDVANVYDRVRVILEIFHQRARSPEARLQVELATLQYETPLIKEYIHLAKKGEHPGYLGGGEYEVNQYYQMMRRRMARIRRDLNRVSDEREVRRKHRRKKGFHLVSLAGYTNAGKSTLLRALSSGETARSQGDTDNGHALNGLGDDVPTADILVENRYFSTLGTKTRRAMSEKREILVTDTVGFIEDLPPWIVDAFHSTLEEIALADVILLVVDASDPLEELARKLRSSLVTLWEINSGNRRDAPHHLKRSALTPPVSRKWAEEDEDEHEDGPMPAEVDPDAPLQGTARVSDDEWLADAMRGPEGLAPILVVLNKADAVPAEELNRKVSALHDEGILGGNWVSVSAREQNGFDALYDAVYALIPDYETVDLVLPPSPETESLIAWAFDATDVIDVTHGNEVHVSLEVKRALLDELRSRVTDAGGHATVKTEAAHPSG